MTTKLKQPQTTTTIKLNNDRCDFTPMHPSGAAAFEPFAHVSLKVALPASASGSPTGSLSLSRYLEHTLKRVQRGSETMAWQLAPQLAALYNQLCNIHSRPGPYFSHRHIPPPPSPSPSPATTQAAFNDHTSPAG